MSTRNTNLRHPVPVEDEIVWIFDIDNCLYRNEKLQDYEEETIKKTFLSLANNTENDWNSHKSSFNLYREIFYSILQVHPIEFSTSYEVPILQDSISPDADLKNILEKSNIRKFCFTNACKNRSAYVLSSIGVIDSFEAVICADIVETEFICKPKDASYTFVQQYLSIKDPKKIYFFDDNLSNVENARKAGWNAIHVCDDIKKYITNEEFSKYI